MNTNMGTRVPSQFSIGHNNGGKTGTPPSSKSTGKAVPVNDTEYQRSAAVVLALSVLSPGEQKDFAECEAVIQRGWQTFVEVGRALARIRDQKLYRAEHDTFETYCRQKW